MKKSFINLLAMTIAFVFTGCEGSNSGSPDLVYVYNNNTKTAAVTYKAEPWNTEPEYLYTGDIVIPESVKYNGTRYEVTGILHAAFSSSSLMTSCIIPNSVTSIVGFAFDECTGLKSIVLPDNITKIEEFTFSGCTGLTSIKIPDNVKGIGSYAFSGCTNLQSLILGKNVEELGEDMMYMCSNLQSITCYAVTPPNAEYAFEHFEIDHVVKLYVPQQSVQAYKNSIFCIFEILPIQ